MDEPSYILAKKTYEYIRRMAAEKDTLDQIDMAYISGLLEGLLVKNGYQGQPESKGFKITDLFRHE